MIWSGVHDEEHGKILHKLIQTEDFRVVVVKDVDTVEMCGALKVCTANDITDLLILSLLILNAR